MGAAPSPTPSIAGVMPVVEVPFLPDERVDLDGFEQVVAHQVEAEVDGVMFPGFASEFHKLAGEERRQLIRLLLGHLDATADGPTSVISISDHATSIAVREACGAVEAGAQAINLLPPFLFAPARDAIVRHLAAVLKAVAPAPVVIQHAPEQTGGQLTAADLASLAQQHPNLAAIKVESQPPGRLVTALLEQEPALPSLVGYAGLHAIDAVERGAVGLQPGCSFPELYVEFWRRWTTGDQAGARMLHSAMLPYLSAWMQHVELIVAVEKRISMQRGWCDHPTVRAPGWTLDRQELASIDAFLEQFAPWLP